MVSRRAVKKERLRVHIRWMIRRDLLEVLEIERDSFDFPWTEEDLLAYLRNRNCIGLVAEKNGGQVIGYCIYEMHHDNNKRWFTLPKFAVHPAYRRMGVGYQMIRKLISKLTPQKRTHIRVHVRETNLDAQLFFQSAGFIAIKIERRYFKDSKEDAYLMEYKRVEE